MAGSSITVKNITKRFGDYTAVDGVSFHIHPGEFVTLLGPSGCGKTTILRMLAGFIVPEQGDIFFGDNRVNDVPPNKRNTAMCFQSYALFPHKTVYENIRFGLRMRKTPPEEQKRRIEWALQLVNLTGLGERKPYELSGGQQQRVALARCAVVQPDLLLFDEPLSNLDAKLREKVRVEIRELQRELGITTIYVTHDQAEALAISDRIIVLNNGRLVQAAEPRATYDLPVSRFVADFIGVANLFDATLNSYGDGVAELTTPLGPMKAACSKKPDNKKLSICIRPEDVLPAETVLDRRGYNTISCKIKDIVYMGNTLDVFMESNGKVVRAFIPKTVDLCENMNKEFLISSNIIHVMEE